MAIVREGWAVHSRTAATSGIRSVEEMINGRYVSAASV
jgi:hypothetical protein